MHRYLFITVNDIESDVIGPFENEDIRDKAAKLIRKDDPEKNNGIFMLNISGHVHLIVTTEDYSGGFFLD